MFPRIERHNRQRCCTAGDCRNMAVIELIFYDRVTEDMREEEYLCVECLKELQRLLDPLSLLVRFGINTKE